ncbi:MAG: threonylcarbamoyl-AMP synthase [Bacteroidales bacterium]|nr:threonylcarbamoyl-AMP synthase [Candidatus Physcousia equi]
MNCDIDLKNAIDVLRKGGVILYPTDTIWGLGCDATNPDAVRRIYEIKKRDDSKALICLVDSANRMQRYFRNVPDVAWDMVDLTSTPLTLILDGASGVAPNLIAEDGSLGIRVTQEEFSRQLCYRFQKAIVSTSANVSGQPSPRNFYDIPDEIKKQVDYIVSFRRGDKTAHQPSKIVKLGLDGAVTIIR